MGPQDEQIRMFIELVDINDPLFVTNCRRKAEEAELERCEAMEAEMLSMAKAGVQPKAAANGGLQSSKVPAKKRKQREESSSSSSSSDSEERRKKKKKKDKSKAKHKKEKKKKKKKDKKEKKERK